MWFEGLRTENRFLTGEAAMYVKLKNGNVYAAWWVEKYTAARDGAKPSDAGWKRIPLTKEKFVKGYLFYNSSTL